MGKKGCLSVWEFEKCVVMGWTDIDNVKVDVTGTRV